MRLAIIVLVALDVALLVALSGVFGPIAGDAREPHRLAQQVRPDRVRVVQSGAAAASAPPVSGPQGQARAAAAPMAGPAASDAAAPAGPASSRPAAASATAAASAALPASAPVPAPEASPAQPAPTSPSAPAQASACIEWGPFTQADVQRARAAAQQAGAQVEPVRRVPEPKSFQVHVPPAADQAAARVRAAQLRQAGIDAYVIPSGPHRWGLSLGVFRTEQGAQALQQQARQRGVADAQVDARGPERWVLRLRGADAPAADWRGSLTANFPGRTFGPCAAGG